MTFFLLDWLWCDLPGVWQLKPKAWMTLFSVQIISWSGALNTVRGSTYDISPPRNCQCWWLRTKVTRGWWGRTTYCRLASETYNIWHMTWHATYHFLRYFSLRRSVPSTSCRHLRKPLLALFLPKISFSNLPRWPPSREFLKTMLSLQ